ncbi:ASGL1 asparaginase, partial [Polyodon spathula]|nr:isoaspartyl peptidase/L-asparaginase isoform X2 [Polyodon spathula]XP_041108020.1 isoaspartyl peptidase/L-asparaginase isoform X2 [Polyodon spathula]MBN3270994.1 ASGL1 asparaginase [Polyodon spathula]
MKPVIVVHGGAWAIPDKIAEDSISGVKNAILEGIKILEKGGSALDAVERAVRSMEDNPVFDAGHGAVLNANGEVELDAVIMDGKTLAAGAVSSIRNISNPVTFARSVMEKTDHVMLTDRGANQYADCQGIPKVATDELITEGERKEWEHYQKYAHSVKTLFNSQLVHDTVGAVALDCSGNVACATSTGGIRNKMVGRVGDTPIIGSGGYADNNIGAVSCTGHGESIMKVTLARLILFHMEQGKSPEQATDEALQYMGKRVHGAGGAIVVSPDGKWAARFTTERMAWASIKEDTLSYGLNPKEMFNEKTFRIAS